MVFTGEGRGGHSKMRCEGVREGGPGGLPAGGRVHILGEGAGTSEIATPLGVRRPVMPRPSIDWQEDWVTGDRLMVTATGPERAYLLLYFLTGTPAHNVHQVRMATNKCCECMTSELAIRSLPDSSKR